MRLVLIISIGLVTALSACKRETTGETATPIGTTPPSPATSAMDARAPQRDIGARGTGDSASGASGAADVNQARAELVSAPGANVDGVVTFTERGGSLLVEANIESGLSAGQHGFHVHETGTCLPPDFKSAGDHFNPTKTKHGGPDAPEHHAGDFGNLQAQADGSARGSITSNAITLGEGPSSVLGKAVVIHKQADDFSTQPAGGAGERLACGVIRPVPPGQ